MAKNDEQIMSALLLAGSVRRAAKIADVSEGTVRNRLKDRCFRAEYDRQRADFVQQITAGIASKLENAVDVAAEILTNPNAPASVRLGAVDALLRHFLRYYGASEIERRLSALEAAQAEEEKR